MKALVLGGEGMLGHKMFQVLRQRFGDVACTVRGALDEPFYAAIELFGAGQVIAGLDVTNREQLRQVLEAARPEQIVNCVGMIKQRKEAEQAIPTIELNALLPHVLAQIASRWNGRVIHFSTDCVFSGRRGNYAEDDPSDAEDLYGKTKLLGEVRGANALTLRTSIIGRELRDFQSLLEWFLAQRGGRVRGFVRHLYSGVTTNHLAALVAELIARHPTLTGLYQVTSERIDKHALLCLLRDAYALDVEIVPDDTTVCDRSMIGDRFRAATGLATPPWPELVAELAADPTPYDKWRRAR